MQPTLTATFRVRSLGGSSRRLLAEDPERTVTQPLGIALAILGKLDACLRDHRRRQTPLSGMGGVLGGTLSHRTSRECQQQKPHHWATVAGFRRSVHGEVSIPSTTFR